MLYRVKVKKVLYTIHKLELAVTSVPSLLFKASFHIFAAYAGCILVHIDMTEVTCKKV